MFGQLDARQLVVCPGAQAAIAALSLVLALTEPGDVILVSEPTSYPGLRAAATQFGRHIIAVEADKHGMLPEMLEEACRQHKSGLVYLNPTLQNPTAITIPTTQAQGARQHREALQCTHRRGRSLLAPCRCPAATHCHVCPEQVVYISTLSKCLTPGLRVAFVLIRDPIERERFLVALRSFALMVAPRRPHWPLSGYSTVRLTD